MCRTRERVHRIRGSRQRLDSKGKCVHALDYSGLAPFASATARGSVQILARRVRQKAKMAYRSEC
jgi:hypothetical protein